MHLQVTPKRGTCAYNGEQNTRIRPAQFVSNTFLIIVDSSPLAEGNVADHCVEEIIRQ